MAKEVNHELIYQTLLDIKEDIGTLKTSYSIGNSRLETVAGSHFKLKDDYTKHKSKLLTISAGLSSVVGIITTTILSFLTGKHN